MDKTQIGGSTMLSCVWIETKSLEEIEEFFK